MSNVASPIAVFYLALPVLAAGWAAYRARRTGSRLPIVGFALSVGTAGAVALGMHWAYGWLVGGTVRAGQVAVTLYLAVGVLAMFRAVAWGLKEGVDRLMRVRTLDGRLALSRPPVRPAVVPAAVDDAVGGPPESQPTGEPLVLAVTSAEAPTSPPAGDPAVNESPPPPRGPSAVPTAYASVPAGGGAWVARAALATVVRGVLLFGVTLVYIVAVGMVYRPKLADGPTPDRLAGVAFEPVSFESADGLRLAGWWMPAAPRPSTRPAAGDVDEASAADDDGANAVAIPLGPPARPAAAPDDGWGRRTVILCHGVGTGKSAVAALARQLVPYGFNVLAFDFRGHGDSGGVLASFGDAERNDVLGAVRWVRASHPDEAGKLFGLGVDTGAAALVAAAADPSPDGRAIDAVALFGVFESLQGWADARAGGNLPRPIDWMARHLSAPLASLHAGADLTSFSPAALVERVAPRPVLVVHGRADEVVPFDQGAAVFESASQPKLRFWVGQQDALKRWVMPADPALGVDVPPKGGVMPRGGPPSVVPPAAPGPPGTSTAVPAKLADHARTVESDEAARAVRLFFETALPLL